MKKSIILIIMVLLFLPILIFSQQICFNGFVDRIIDADTYKIYYTNIPMTIRLTNIDAFESRDNKRLEYQMKVTNIPKERLLILGSTGKKLIHDLISHKCVCICINNEKPTGKYGRYLSIVYPLNCQLINNSYESINELLIKKHLAIRYKK